MRALLIASAALLVGTASTFSAPALAQPKALVVGKVSPALCALALRRPKAARSSTRVTGVAGLQGSLEIPAAYGAVMSTAAFSAGMVQWAAIKVSIARKQYGVKYPKMYEGTEDSVFDCVQRAHQNTLEYLPSFLALLMLNGLAAPLSTAAVGMVWNVARIVYVIGYGKGDPNGRLPGAAVSGLAFIGLVLATFANGVLQSGILPTSA